MAEPDDRQQAATRRGGRDWSWPVLGVLLALAGGCARPSQANIELRKQNAALREEVARLQRLREGDQATIRALEADRPTVQRLSAERLQTLFTAHGLVLGRLTGGADLLPDKPGDEALRVVVAPVDEAGHTLKAAGQFVVEAFDLALPTEQRIGQWTIDLPTARERWHASGLVQGYVFELPWQQPPRHAELTVKVTFADALTGRTLSAQRVVSIKPPAEPEPLVGP